MCQFDTTRRGLLATVVLLCLAGPMHAQTYEFALNWRAIGTSLIAKDRAGFSGGPLAGVWFSADGSSIEVQLFNGRTYQTEDFETWAPTARAGNRAGLASKAVDSLPEPEALVFAAPGNSYRAYAAGKWLWRSDDTGNHWANLVSNSETLLIGENIRGLSVSPQDPDRVAVITDEGLWLTTDGGNAWLSLNAGLPNIRLTRLLAAPQGGLGLLAEWQNGEIVEWLPGSKAAWFARGERAPLRQKLGWVDPVRPELLLEVSRQDRSRLRRSLDGGLRWDDLTSDLPATEIYGLAADKASGAIYLATERGIYYTLNSLETASSPTSWIRLGGNLPREAALDVMLNEGGNFLYVSLAGEGVFLTHAPHRRRQPALISAADFATRSAAPGALISVLGMKLSNASIGGAPLPVLSASIDESQLQIPYDAVIPSPGLDLGGEGRNLHLDLEIAPTAPAIFTDRDGAPLLLDADTGELLDPAQPLRAGMRIQLLLTGLGQVEPAWPTGLAAPAVNSPKVVAPVSVWLNDQTLEVSRAELAGGYVGFYAVETRLPPILDKGFASLRVEAGGRFSNTIRVQTCLE